MDFGKMFSHQLKNIVRFKQEQQGDTNPFEDLMRNIKPLNQSNPPTDNKVILPQQEIPTNQREDTEDPWGLETDQFQNNDVEQSQNEGWDVEIKEPEVVIVEEPVVKKNLERKFIEKPIVIEQPPQPPQQNSKINLPQSQKKIVVPIVEKTKDYIQDDKESTKQKKNNNPKDQPKDKQDFLSLFKKINVPFINEEQQPKSGQVQQIQFDKIMAMNQQIFIMKEIVEQQRADNTQYFEDQKLKLNTELENKREELIQIEKDIQEEKMLNQDLITEVRMLQKIDQLDYQPGELGAILETTIKENIQLNDLILQLQANLDNVTKSFNKQLSQKDEELISKSQIITLKDTEISNFEEQLKMANQSQDQKQQGKSNLIILVELKILTKKIQDQNDLINKLQDDMDNLNEKKIQMEMEASDLKRNLVNIKLQMGALKAEITDLHIIIDYQHKEHLICQSKQEVSSEEIKCLKNQSVESKYLFTTQLEKMQGHIQGLEQHSRSQEEKMLNLDRQGKMTNVFNIDLQNQVQELQKSQIIQQVEKNQGYFINRNSIRWYVNTEFQEKAKDNSVLIKKVQLIPQIQQQTQNEGISQDNAPLDLKEGWGDDISDIDDQSQNNNLISIHEGQEEQIKVEGISQDNALIDLKDGWYNGINDLDVQSPKIIQLDIEEEQDKEGLDDQINDTDKQSPKVNQVDILEGQFPPPPSNQQQIQYEVLNEEIEEGWNNESNDMDDQSPINKVNLKEEEELVPMIQEQNKEESETVIKEECIEEQFQLSPKIGETVQSQEQSIFQLQQQINYEDLNEEQNSLLVEEGWGDDIDDDDDPEDRQQLLVNQYDPEDMYQLKELNQSSQKEQQNDAELDNSQNNYQNYQQTSEIQKLSEEHPNKQIESCVLVINPDIDDSETREDVCPDVNDLNKPTENPINLQYQEKLSQLEQVSYSKGSSKNEQQEDSQSSKQSQEKRDQEYEIIDDYQQIQEDEQIDEYLEQDKQQNELFSQLDENNNFHDDQSLGDPKLLEQQEKQQDWDMNISPRNFQDNLDNQHDLIKFKEQIDQNEKQQEGSQEGFKDPFIQSNNDQIIKQEKMLQEQQEIEHSVNIDDKNETQQICDTALNEIEQSLSVEVTRQNPKHEDINIVTNEGDQGVSDLGKSNFIFQNEMDAPPNPQVSFNSPSKNKEIDLNQEVMILEANISRNSYQNVLELYSVKQPIQIIDSPPRSMKQFSFEKQEVDLQGITLDDNKNIQSNIKEDLEIISNIKEDSEITQIDNHNQVVVDQQISSTSQNIYDEFKNTFTTILEEQNENLVVIWDDDQVVEEDDSQEQDGWQIEDETTKVILNKKDNQTRRLIQLYQDGLLQNEDVLKFYADYIL